MFKIIISLLTVIGLFYIIVRLLQRYTKIGVVIKGKASCKIGGITYIDEQTKVVHIIHNKNS